MATEKTADAAPKTCPVATTLKALRKQLRMAENASPKLRAPLASAVRIITEIHLGRGVLTHLTELDALSNKLATIAPAASNVLSASLKDTREEWLDHIADGLCETNACMQPRTVPCQEACPAHIDIPSMIAYVGQGQYKESLNVLLQDTPLPNSCGLVCPAPCENACVQKDVSTAVLIKPMKSVAARCANGYPLPPCDAPTGKKVAIVGSGPAGLTAAYYLVQKGHEVDIYDEREHAGGIMRYGIPEYRLPNSVLNSEIDMIKSLGVKIHNKSKIANVQQLLDKQFDAVFLATGLQKSKCMGVEGVEHPFVIGGMDFLSAVREGKNPRVGPHVIVIGDAAIDVAMTAFRQGATKVQMWYRRTRKDMPANPHEVEMALAEGVELVELWAPNKVLPDNQIEFTRSKNAPDAETTKPIIVKADQVIVGIGQDSDLDYVRNCAIEQKWGTIVADPVTLMTGIPGVFSGGDIQHGASTVVAAIGSGKRVAESIHSYLTNKQMDLESLKPQRRAFAPLVTGHAETRTDPHRPHVPETDPIERRTQFTPIQLDFDENVARTEAERCLRCDLCIGCGLCELACTEVGAEALRMVDTTNGRLVFDGFLRPATMCIGCGACAAVCPTGAITVETVGNERITTITGTVVRKQPLMACASCGEPWATKTQFEAMQKRLGLSPDAPCICPSCARKMSGNVMNAMYR